MDNSEPVAAEMPWETLESVRQVLDEALQLDGRSNHFTEATPLLGSLPELDSMAVVSLVTALETHFGIVVDDDEITAETFETLGSLTAFVDNKLS